MMKLLHEQVYRRRPMHPAGSSELSYPPSILGPCRRSTWLPLGSGPPRMAWSLVSSCWDAGYRGSTIAERRRSGQWVEVCRGVYRHGGSPASWRARCRAAVLVMPDGVVSHEAACRMLGIGGLAPAQRDIVVLSTPSNRRRCGPWRLHVRRSLPEADVAESKGLPCTTPERTLADLAARLSAARLGRVVDHALGSGIADLGRLVGRTDTGSAGGPPGTRRLREVLAPRLALGAVAQSELERRFVEVIADAGLPMPLAQSLHLGRSMVGRFGSTSPTLRNGWSSSSMVGVGTVTR